MDNMMKFAIRNYIYSFRWSHIKECFKNGTLYAYTFLIFSFWVLPTNRTENFLVETLLVLPTIFIFLSSSIYSAALPKLLYLCPLNRDMRSEYIEKARLIRTAVPIIFTSLIVAGLFFSGQVHWLISLIILINNVIFSIFMGTVYSNRHMNANMDLNHTQEKTVPHAAFLEVLVIGFGFFITWLYSNCYVDYHSAGTLTLFIFSAILLIPLPATIFYLKHWPYMLKQWLSYETSSYYPTTQKIERKF